MKHRIYRLAPKDFVSGLALLFVVLLLPLSAAAQVTVKDSVVVASPPDTTGEEGSTAVRVLPSSSLAKVAANVSLPEGGQIVVTIIGGAGAAVHDLVLRSPISVTIVQNANANHGFTWVSPVFPAGTTVDLGLIWYWWGMTGSEWGSQTTRLNDSTYQIGFEDIGFSPLYVDVIVRVVVRRVQNNPPVITSVVFDPARRYFAYGSEVSVRAEAVDPDGDAVTISYAPGSTFTLNTFGAVVVTVTATDSKGASTTRTETIYSVAVGITPPVDRVIDGGAASYRVYIAPQEIAASSFE